MGLSKDLVGKRVDVETKRDFMGMKELWTGKLVDLDEEGNIMLEKPVRYLYGYLDGQMKKLPFKDKTVILAVREIANIRPQ